MRRTHLRAAISLAFVGGGVIAYGMAAASEDARPGMAGAGALMVVVALLVIAAGVLRGGRRARTIRRGVRVPVVLTGAKRLGGNASSGHTPTRHQWLAHLPGSGTREFTTKDYNTVPVGTWLEAAMDGDDLEIVLDLDGYRAARDRDKLAEAEDAAAALRRAQGASDRSHSASAPAPPSLKDLTGR